MQGLSSQDINTLLAPKPKRVKNSLTKNRSKFIIVKDENGHLVKSDYVTSLISRYEGKAGTMARSRKGRTRRNANGRRYFVAVDHPDTVVAYKV